ncbi:MAG TPA: class I SAM-dependent methyltransferase [Mycobacteriales bacterium]|nr:class I SAM-dependent methyltransferase [Mycobacteriales bacterium]
MSEEDLLSAQQRNRAQYARVASAYAVSASHAGGAELSWFAARATSVAPGLAVDVACGGGFSTRALIAAGHRVLATDLTPESVLAARQSTDGAALGWVAGSAERLPVSTAAVQLVSCRIAAHHFGDVARFVDEVTRVLTPGGMLLLVDTTVPEDDELARWLDEVERLRDPSHGQSWSPARWHAVCAGARLRVDETQLTRKRHELEPWLARAGCVGARAEEVRRRFREANAPVRAAYDIEVDDTGTVAAYTDSKICLRATKPA